MEELSLIGEAPFSTVVFGASSRSGRDAADPPAMAGSWIRPRAVAGASKFRRLAITHAAMTGGDAVMLVALADSLFFSIDPEGTRARSCCSSSSASPRSSSSPR